MTIRESITEYRQAMTAELEAALELLGAITGRSREAILDDYTLDLDSNICGIEQYGNREIVGSVDWPYSLAHGVWFHCSDGSRLLLEVASATAGLPPNPGLYRYWTIGPVEPGRPPGPDYVTRDAPNGTVPGRDGGDDLDLPGVDDTGHKV